MSITSNEIIVPAFVAGRCRPTQGEAVACTLADIMGAAGIADALPCLSTIRCTDSERQTSLSSWIHDASERERARARILYDLSCAADRLTSAETEGDTDAAGAAEAEIAQYKRDLDDLKADLCALGFSSICECTALDDQGAALFPDGLLLIDIDLDHDAIGGEIDALERRLADDPHVIATWRSRRGEGLHGAYVCAADGASYELARAYILEDYRKADVCALSRSHTWIALPGFDWSAKGIDVVEASDDEKAAYLARKEAERVERTRTRATAKDATERQKGAYFDAFYEGLVSECAGHLSHADMLSKATWAGVVLRDTDSKDQLDAVAELIYEATKGGKTRESRAAVKRQILWGIENSEAHIDMKPARKRTEWTPPPPAPDIAKKLAKATAEATETRATPATADTATDTGATPTGTEDTDATPSLALDDVAIPDRARKIQEYFAERAEKTRTEAARRALDDPLVGGFVRAVDPYSMRQYAPAFCLIAWGIVALSHYDVMTTTGTTPTNPRIANIVARTSAGKDWTLGTHPKSRSLCAQLRETDGVAASVNADASVTGNGMSFAAYLWAADPDNGGKVRVTFWPEMGNAQSRGYGTAERAGSIGNYDMAINYGRISKPTNKSDQRKCEGLADEYPLKAAEIRAFQDTNGAKIAIARHRGAGEARREMWLYMDSPTADPACTDSNRIDFEQALKTSAFMPEACDRAYGELRRAALPFRPVPETFDGEARTRITVDVNDPRFRAVWDYLTGNPDRPINAFLAKDRHELLQDKLYYLAGMSAGLHGRYEANESDYWIAGYLCECLSDSMDRIMAAGTDAPTDDQSVRAQVLERVEMAGARGVYRKNLLRIADKKTLDDLCGRYTLPDGGDGYDPDAPLAIVYDKNHTLKYVLAKHKPTK